MLSTFSKYQRERFWQKVEIGDTLKCWRWLASTNEYGCGQFNLNGKNMKAHRVIFMLMNGEIPEGGQVRHTCGEHWCVNPHHMKLHYKENHHDLDGKI